MLLHVYLSNKHTAKTPTQTTPLAATFRKLVDLLLYALVYVTCQLKDNYGPVWLGG
jgi:hypothetical protein